jgi:hypothetical protein
MKVVTSVGNKGQMKLEFWVLNFIFCNGNHLFNPSGRQRIILEIHTTPFIYTYTIIYTLGLCSVLLDEWFHIQMSCFLSFKLWIHSMGCSLVLHHITMQGVITAHLLYFMAMQLIWTFMTEWTTSWFPSPVESYTCVTDPHTLGILPECKRKRTRRGRR